jgi:predicted nucleotidyltransferase
MKSISFDRQSQRSSGAARACLDQSTYRHPGSPAQRALREFVVSHVEQMAASLGGVGGLWGSLSRLEMTPSSDIDVVVAVPRPDCANVSKPPLLEGLDDLDVDVLSYAGSSFLQDWALENGTDFHGLYFAQNLGGETKAVHWFREQQHAVWGDARRRAREVWSILLSQHAVAKFVDRRDKKWAKLSNGGTNSWVRLGQAVQLWHPDLLRLTAQEALVAISPELEIEPTEIRQSWGEALRHRVEAECSGFEAAISRRVEANRLWIQCRSSLLSKILPWLQASAPIPRVLAASAVAWLGCQLDDTLAPQGNICDSTKAMVHAFIESKAVRLRELQHEYGSDWWVAHALAVNMSTPPDSLDAIVRPRNQVDPHVWRSVRLYAAKNPSTDVRTLAAMLGMAELRNQDHEAARLNLMSRNTRTRPPTLLTAKA